MLTTLMPFLLLSPSLMVEFSIDRKVFPEGVDDWDRIGLFKLKDGDEDRVVLLYCYDSDSVTEKRMAKHGIARFTYPNSFELHAIYQTAPGKWIHKEVCGYSRVRFSKVKKVAPDHLILECRPNFIVDLTAEKDRDKALKRAKEINKPFSKRVSFVDGVLTAK